MDLRNWEFYVDNGNPVNGAAVYVRDAVLTHPNANTVVASTTTDPNGMWAVTGLTNTPKDVEVVWGNTAQYHKWYKGMTQHNVDLIFFGSAGDVVKGKNRLINGAFPVWQHGTSGPTATDNAYGPDGWRLLIEAATAATMAQETSDTPSGAGHYALKLAIGAANNNKIGVFQPIEGADIWDLRGGVASLQFQMKASDPRIGDVRAAVVQWTGTEDAISADPINVWGAAGVLPTYTGSWATANTPAALVPTTTWTQYKIENIPISASATNLAVFIWIQDKTTTAGDYLLLTEVQLEKGPIATSFEWRSKGEVLRLAQKTFWKSFAQGVTPIGNSASTVGAVLQQAWVATANFMHASTTFPTTMRATPALTYINIYGFNNNWGNLSTTADVGTLVGTLAVSDRGFTAFGAFTPVAGQYYGFHALASAEL
jgi:hypothetical protein